LGFDSSAETAKSGKTRCFLMFRDVHNAAREGVPKVRNQQQF